MYPEDRSTQPPPPSGRTRVYVAGAVRDAAGVNASPGAVAIREGRIVAAGEVEAVLVAAGANAERVDLHDRLLIPGLVNAHTHLDLTGVGFRPYGGDFVGWIRMVIAERPKAERNSGEAVWEGAYLSVNSGVFTVGDIAGNSAATVAVRGSPLRGVSYRELIGISDQAHEAALSRIPPPEVSPEGNVRVGLQPHAPYSTGPRLYSVAHGARYVGNRPASTHLAETLEELEFVATATGPFRNLLEDVGKWDNQFEAHYNKGEHPVEWLANRLNFYEGQQRPWLVAHCNYVDESHIALLKKYRFSVAYCPRASEYFGHKYHRYRDMIAAGVNVCLGTDSIICHGSLSILDEMRRLHQRDGTDPGLLLKMATVNGMRGLCMDEKDATFSPGANPGVVAIRYDGRPGVDPLGLVLGADHPPEIEVLELPAT